VRKRGERHGAALIARRRIAVEMPACDTAPR
jgi:hypothetical protein